MKNYIEIVPLHEKTVKKKTMSPMEWAQWVENMLGPPEKYNRFILRSHESNVSGMFITKIGWASTVKQAEILDWGETAVRITNNRKLEAIRVDNEGICEASDGEIIGAL